jgi:hypothetical protein
MAQTGGAETVPHSKVRLTFECKKLRNMDTFSSTPAFAHETLVNPWSSFRPLARCKRA